MKSEINTVAKKLVTAFDKGKLIAPIPSKFSKNTKNANALRLACESLIKSPIIGFKAG